MLSACLRRVDQDSRTIASQDRECKRRRWDESGGLEAYTSSLIDCRQSSFKRYPELRDRFNSVVINFFKESMVPTNKLVTDMVA